MYPHRPDLLSFTFGLVFLALGLAAVISPGGIPGLDPVVVLGALAVAGGVGLVGTLATGDVHLGAARRMAAREEARRSSVVLPAPPSELDRDLLTSVLDDPLFGPPIDPDELDRVYRETFGGDDPATHDPAVGPRSPDGSAGGEGAAHGAPG